MDSFPLENIRPYLEYFKLTRDVFYVIDDRLVVRIVSPGVEAVLGYRPEELVGRRIDETGVIHPDDIDEAVGNTLSLLAGRKVNPTVYRFLSKNGEVHYGEVQAIPATEGGRATGVLAVARDVSDAIRAQEALQEYSLCLEEMVAEKTRGLDLFRFMVEASQEEIYLVRPDGSLAYVNRAAAESLGYGVQELLDLNVADFESGSGARFAYVLDALKTGGAQLFQTEHRTKDGRQVVKEIHCSSLKMDGEEFVCWFARDVTERRMAEAALRESERRFRDLAENTSDLVWETDESLRFTYMNRTVVNHLGFPPEDRIGKTLTDVLPADEARKLETFMRSLVESPRSFHNLEYRALHADGTYRVRQASGIPIFDDEGRFRGYRGVTRDITEERAALERLEASEKLFSAVFRSSPVPMVVSHIKDGLIMDCNVSFETWSGYARDGIIGKTSVELGLWLDISDRGRFTAELDRQGFLDAWETQFRISGGARRDVLLSARLIEVDGSELLLTQVSDITERKRMEAELAASRSMFEAAFHASPAPMVITRVSDGTILDANDFCIAWSGYEKHEVIGRTTVELGFWEDRRSRDLFAREVHACGAAEFPRMHYRRKSGEIREVDHSASIIEIQGVPCILSHIQDVTDMRMAQKALLESEERLRGIADNFPGVVFQFHVNENGEWAVTYLSERSGEVLGLDNEPEGFVERCMACISEEDRERFRQSVDEAVRSFGTWDFTCRFIKPSREEILVRGISRPSRRQGELIFNGVLLDVTHQHMQDEELKRYRLKLEELVRERTEELTREIEARKRTEAELRNREVELENRRVDLEEMNAALRVLLRQRDEDKGTLETNVLSNIRTFVLPHIDRLEGTNLTEKQRSSLDMIRSHLTEITSSFVQKVASVNLGLTPAEIQVASLIREGKTSKEIARLLNISLNTVQTYRFHIRSKTGLKNKRANLRAYLKSLE